MYYTTTLFKRNRPDIFCVLEHGGYHRGLACGLVYYLFPMVMSSLRILCTMVNARSTDHNELEISSHDDPASCCVFYLKTVGARASSLVTCWCRRLLTS
jgi:hypothetical protein